MKYIYAVTSERALSAYQEFADIIHSKLSTYLHFLAQTYHVADLPKCIVFTSAESATQLISNIPLPAYTNAFRTVFCPDLESWRAMYLKQLDDLEESEESRSVKRYYDCALTNDHVLQILGHEFVHHSELFIDDAYDKARWFEEGMCEYISRKFFLSDNEFREEAEINMQLVSLRLKNHAQPLGDFSAATYEENIGMIFYEYWRSFLAVNQIVGHFGGDVMAVFQEYHRWFDENNDQTLEQWFDTVL